VPRRSKHPLLIDHTRRKPSSMIMNAELSAFKVSVCSFRIFQIELRGQIGAGAKITICIVKHVLFIRTFSGSGTSC
jgi:hypothetical protein